MKDYKVETKPSWWHVTLSIGSYSDYEESHLFFSGNDEFEVWDFLKRYTNDMINPNYLNKLYKWEGERFVSDKYTGNVDSVDWDCDWQASDVMIERLNVIHFLK